MQSFFHNQRSPRFRTTELVGILLVAAIFGLTAWFGISLTLDEGRIAAVWIPNAILLAMLIRVRRGMIGPLFAACFVANVTADHWRHSIERHRA